MSTSPIDQAREVFLAERRRGIGGSDIAALVGLDPRKTPYQLWREKLGLDVDAATNRAALRRGNFLEPAIIARYAALLKPASLEPNIRHQAGEDGWRRGNQDARAISADGVRRVVEAKSVNRNVFRTDWGTPWSDEVPDRALCQGLWYGVLDDADIVDFAVCVVPDDPDEVLGLTADEVLAISDFHIFQARRHAEIEDYLLTNAHAFWHLNVKQRVEPEPRTEEDVALRWARHITGQMKPAEPVLQLVRRYAAACDTANEAKRDRESLREQLLLYAQGAEALCAADGITPWLTMKTESRAAHSVAASTSRPLRFIKWWNRLPAASRAPAATTQPTPQPMEN